jgi:beta-glucosidase
MPEGTGAANQKGLDFYNRLIDELLKSGIRPFVTLFHWDYPSALQARGAWENPDSVKWFEEYAALCARTFGDRVKDFITFNEPQCFVGLGYDLGVHAPGLQLPNSSLVPMSHHILKAHGAAARALRSLVPDVRVGYAPCGDPCMPATNSPEDLEAARKAYFTVQEKGWTFNAAWWSDPALLGCYPESGLKHLEKYLPKNWQEDLTLIHQPLDFYGQNIYNGRYYKAADNELGFEMLPLPVGFPKTAIQWPITPDALYWGPYFLYERYRTPFIMTENGLSAHDVVSLDGKVHDPNRQDFLNRYLLAYKRAAENGVDIRGYFHWSLMDNYEWAHGYKERFGLIHVDYQTQQRTLKDSAYWYRSVIEQNGENL